MEPVKEQQRASWDIAAQAWRGWWPVIQRGTDQVTREMCERAGLGPGFSVLDVATGVGEPALSAARAVGMTGRVVATDISPAMLAVAVERAVEAGVHNVDFRVSDAEVLDLPSGAFDAALCRFGLMFCPDVSSALGGIQDALVPGGAFAAATWGPPDRAPLITLPMEIISQRLQLSSVPVEGPGIFSLCEQDALVALLSSSGFVEVRIGTAMVAPTFVCAEQYVEYMREVAAPLTQLLAAEPIAAQQRIWEAVADAVRPYSRPDGSVTLSAEALVVSGRRAR